MCAKFIHPESFSTYSFRVSSNVTDRLVGLVVRCPPRERKVPGSNPACAGIFLGSSHTSDSKIGTPVATLPGSGLGLVGPVSVYCDWVRWKVGSATSISVWQHVKLCRSVPETHSHVAGTLSNKQTKVTVFRCLKWLDSQWLAR